MKLTLGFSPCPNDTFIFDALVNNKIDTGNLSFDVVLEDVQTLNQWAIDGRLDISKISYGVLPLVLQQYCVLHAGGALGKGVGPLLIAKAPLPAGTNLRDKTIAIPGENTTAHLLFSLAYPEAVHKQFLVFSDIEEAVLEGHSQLGVIIHENRFTYMKKGLVKIADLGAFWEQHTQSPVPLGGIVIKKNTAPALQQKLDELIQQSIRYAFERYPLLPEYITRHAQEMEEQVMRQHIDLYVNNYSLDPGSEGKKAILELLQVYHRMHPHTVLVQEGIFAE